MPGTIGSLRRDGQRQNLSRSRRILRSFWNSNYSSPHRQQLAPTWHRPAVRIEKDKSWEPLNSQALREVAISVIRCGDIRFVAAIRSRIKALPTVRREGSLSSRAGSSVSAELEFRSERENSSRMSFFSESAATSASADLQTIPGPATQLLHCDQHAMRKSSIRPEPRPQDRRPRAHGAIKETHRTTLHRQIQSFPGPQRRLPLHHGFFAQGGSKSRKTSASRRTGSNSCNGACGWQSDGRVAMSKPDAIPHSLARRRNLLHIKSIRSRCVRVFLQT